MIIPQLELPPGMQITLAFAVIAALFILAEVVKRVRGGK